MSAALVMPNFTARDNALSVKTAADRVYRAATGVWDSETEAKVLRALDALNSEVASLSNSIPQGA